jgi:hypothetical protein
MALATKTDTEIKTCLKDFLEHVAPYQKAAIEDLAVKAQYDDINKPEIEAFCDSEKCGDIRYFDCDGSFSSLSNGELTIVGLRYCCRHCLETYKWFALLTVKTKESCSGYTVKLGEWPPFGEPVPPRVLSLIEPEKQLFLKGKDSEDKGFGIGAFAYYRRVVENQWPRLMDEIIKVLTHLKKPAERIENFKKAKNQTRFSDAVTSIKDEIPESLLIAGHHNPLALLQKVLDEAGHNLSDNECLKRAKSIRLILCELSEKLAIALKDQPELQGALTELFAPDKGPEPDAQQQH